MATQTTRTNEPDQRQNPQSPVATRGSQQGRYPLGMTLTPVDFFPLNPFSLLRGMTAEIERAFVEPSTRGQKEVLWEPAIEVTRRDNELIVRAELPGMNIDDVKLEISDDQIIIHGERKTEREEKQGAVQVTELRYGEFYRAIPLPDGAKVDQAQAKYENGVLQLTVPIADEKTKRREIPIQGKPSDTSGSSQKAA
jgi:HSP20 family protein